MQAEEDLWRPVRVDLMTDGGLGIRDAHGRAEIDELDGQRFSPAIDQHDVLCVDVGVDETNPLEDTEGGGHLLVRGSE